MNTKQKIKALACRQTRGVVGGNTTGLVGPCEHRCASVYPAEGSFAVGTKHLSSSSIKTTAAAAAATTRAPFSSVLSVSDLLSVYRLLSASRESIGGRNKSAPSTSRSTQRQSRRKHQRQEQHRQQQSPSQQLQQQQQQQHDKDGVPSQQPIPARDATRRRHSHNTASTGNDDRLKRSRLLFDRQELGATTTRRRWSIRRKFPICLPLLGVLVASWSKPQPVEGR